MRCGLVAVQEQLLMPCVSMDDNWCIWCWVGGIVLHGHHISTFTTWTFLFRTIVLGIRFLLHFWDRSLCSRLYTSTAQNAVTNAVNCWTTTPLRRWLFGKRSLFRWGSWSRPWGGTSTCYGPDQSCPIGTQQRWLKSKERLLQSLQGFVFQNIGYKL